MASIAVKVPTAKVIAMLQDKIAVLKAEITNYPTAKADYAKSKADHEKNLIALTIDALTNKPEFIGDSNDSPIRVSAQVWRGNSVSITLDADALGFPEAPTEPKNPNEAIWVGREHIKPLEILENTLKTLLLTEQETISASTYANVMRLL